MRETEYAMRNCLIKC